MEVYGQDVISKIHLAMVISKTMTTYTQDYNSNINFMTDVWLSPNHYAYVAFTAHFEVWGQPIAIVLDIVEVPEVRLSTMTATIAEI
jgi:hypothetical protein